MKIAFIDLNYPDHFEDYSYNPIKYGGARIVPAPCMEHDENFIIYSDERSFKNVRKEKLSQCKNLNWEQREGLRNGISVKKIIPEADDYDLFFWNATDKKLNLSECKSKKHVVWSIGWRETINKEIENLICFSYEFQQPIILGNPKVHHAVIGPKMEPFKEYKKEDLIFQCTRHTNCFQSIIVAQLALKYNIQTIFAGPIEKNYPLLDFVDNKTTHYIGEISNDKKVEYNKIAKFHTQFQTYPTCATLSAKEALSYGTPIMATPIGEWPNFIKNNINGIIISTEQDFLNAWNKRNEFKQIDCYNSAINHSEKNMLKTFYEIFKNI